MLLKNTRKIDNMKITLAELRIIIRSVISASMTEKKNLDKDRDGDNDFADIMMTRMKKGGLDDEETYKKSRKFDESDEVDEAST